MQGLGHPKASKCIPGLGLPMPFCSSPSTGQTVQCSAELMKCKKGHGLPHNTKLINVHLIKSSQCTTAIKGNGSFPKGILCRTSSSLLHCSVCPYCPVVWDIISEMCIELDATEYGPVTVLSQIPEIM